MVAGTNNNNNNNKVTVTPCNKQYSLEPQ